MSLAEPLTARGLGEGLDGLDRSRTFLDLGLMPHLMKIRDIAREDLKRNYDSEGRGFGAPWPLLTEASQDHRNYLAKTFGLPIGDDHPILVNFGDLRASVVEKHGMGHEERVDQYTVTIASTHKKGGMAGAMAGIVDRGEGSAPARRLVHPKGGSTKAVNQMQRELEDHAKVVARIVEGN